VDFCRAISRGVGEEELGVRICFTYKRVTDGIWTPEFGFA
jgi:hypothetical protein